MRVNRAHYHRQNNNSNKKLFYGDIRFFHPIFDRISISICGHRQKISNIKKRDYCLSQNEQVVQVFVEITLTIINNKINIILKLLNYSQHIASTP